LLRRVFKAFQYRDFRLMWFGACTSSIGTWMQNVAQAWLVFNLSKSSFYLGLDSFLGQIPIMLFSLLGGVVADRMERRKLLLMSQFIQMTTAFTLTALIVLGVVRIWHILVLSFVVGTAQSFGGPAYSALIPNLVKKEDLSNAIALNSIQFNLARVIGPMLGGIFLGIGAAWCFGLNGASFIAVIVTLMMIQTRFIPPDRSGSLITSMKQGVGFIRNQSGMSPLIVLAFFMTMLSIPMLVFLPVFARDVFHRGATFFTILLCCSGLGSVGGALVVAFLGRYRNQGLVGLLLLIVLGGLVFGFSVSANPVLSEVLVFFYGAVLMGVFATNTSLVQLITTDAMRGRVMSVYNVAFRGGMPIGSLLVGALAQRYTAPVVLAWNGVLLVLLGAYFMLMHRRIATL
jgi:predicted MFS family arabinose efflux permease